MASRTKQFDNVFPAFVSSAEHTVLLPTIVSEGIDRDRAAKDAAATAARSLAGSGSPEKAVSWEQSVRNRQAAAEEQRKAEEAANNPVLPAWKSKRMSRKRFTHRVYDETVLASKSSASLLTTVKDERERKRLAVVHRFWVALGGRRQIAVPIPEWRAALSALAVEMPNFSAVVDYLAGEFALAELAKQPPLLAPILLDGPPGVGKTTFARKLADLFRTGFISISMETAQTAAALSGSEQYWGNSKPGQLFSVLMEGEFANPVVLVDEIDKARAAHDYDPAAALYGLLESGSAARWSDLSVPYLTLDASRVVCILTSNTKQRVPLPLLSRMQVFDIAILTADQAHQTAKRIFAEVVEALGINFESEVPRATAEMMATASPREMLRMARGMVARAVLAGRLRVITEDFGSFGLGAITNKTIRVSVKCEESKETIDAESAVATKH